MTLSSVLEVLSRLILVWESINNCITTENLISIFLKNKIIKYYKVIKLRSSSNGYNKSSLRSPYRDLNLQLLLLFEHNENTVYVRVLN